MSCLILDQSQDVRESLAHMLLAIGIRGIPVSNKEEGLGAFDAHSDIDSAIVDVDSRESEGLALIQELKAQESTKAVRVIIHSARSDREFVVKTVDLGIYGYLLKPFHEDKTLLRIKELLIDALGANNEKRQHIRVSPDPGSLLRLHFRVPAHDKLITGKIRNISMGGLAVELLNPPDSSLLKSNVRTSQLQFALGSKKVSPTCRTVVLKGSILAQVRQIWG